jgi:hypothetical protein
MLLTTHLIYFIIILLTVYIVCSWKLRNVEHLTNTNDFDISAIKNLSDIAAKLVTGGLTIPGNVKIAGTLDVVGKSKMSDTSIKTLNVTDGSNFSGGRHFFTDTEKCGRLRVGCAWGKPGIYAEDNKSLVLGASNDIIDVNSQLKSAPGKNLSTNHLTVTGGSNFKGGRHYFTDVEKCGRLRVGCAWAKPGVYAEDGKALAIGGANGWVDSGSNINLTGNNQLHAGYIKSRGDSEADGVLRAGHRKGKMVWWSD